MVVKCSQKSSASPSAIDILFCAVCDRTFVYNTMLDYYCAIPEAVTRKYPPYIVLSSRTFPKSSLGQDWREHICAKARTSDSISFRINAQGSITCSIWALASGWWIYWGSIDCEGAANIRLIVPCKAAGSVIAFSATIEFTAVSIGVDEVSRRRETDRGNALSLLSAGRGCRVDHYS